MPKQSVNKFSPDKDYQWKGDDKFEITGMELEYAHNILASIMSGRFKDPQMYLALNELLGLTSNVIQRNVESGLIKEVPIKEGEKETQEKV